MQTHAVLYTHLPTLSRRPHELPHGCGHSPGHACPLGARGAPKPRDLPGQCCVHTSCLHTMHTGATYKRTGKKDMWTTMCQTWTQGLRVLTGVCLQSVCVAVHVHVHLSHVLTPMCMYPIIWSRTCMYLHVCMCDVFLIKGEFKGPIIVKPYCRGK